MSASESSGRLVSTTVGVSWGMGPGSATSHRRLLTALGVSAALSTAACGGDDGASDRPDAATIDAVAAIDAPVAIDAPLGVDAVAPTHSIQEIQDGTVATGAEVRVEKVFVTALRMSPAGSVIAFLQEPDGHTTGGHPYPEYAGVQLFVYPEQVTPFPGLNMLQVGDCISIAGSTLEFQNNTEIVVPTAFTLEAGGSCGTAPTPFVVPTGAIDFTALATDTDGATAGDQPGAASERYEGVLIKVMGVTAPTATDATTGEFRVVRTAGGKATLAIARFMYTDNAPVPATAGQVFASITGIYAERMWFKVLPRSLADLQ